MMKKYGLKPKQVLTAVNEILENVSAVPIGIDIVAEALRICDRYGYSYYDSRILAAGSGVIVSERALLLYFPFLCFSDFI